MSRKLPTLTMIDLDVPVYKTPPTYSGEEYNSIIKKHINTKIKNEDIKNIANEIHENIKKNREDTTIQNFIINNNNKPDINQNIKDFDFKENDIDVDYVISLKNTLYSDKNTIIKVINYQCDPHAEYIIIKELAFQIYSFHISQDCDFITPEILDFGKFKVNNEENIKFHYNCVFYIHMVKINYPKLEDYIDWFKENPKDCKHIETKIDNINSCMNGKGIYHNDLHPGNILMNENENNEIGILDYGLATDTDEKIEFKKYGCDTLLGNKETSPVSVANWWDEEGGKSGKSGKSKKRRNNKNKRKTRRNRRKSKKNQPK